MDRVIVKYDVEWLSTLLIDEITLHRLSVYLVTIKMMITIVRGGRGSASYDGNYHK